MASSEQHRGILEVNDEELEHAGRGKRWKS